MKLGYKITNTTEQDGFIRLNATSDTLSFKHRISKDKDRYMIFEVKSEANNT